jgi:hypothetical protein
MKYQDCAEPLQADDGADNALVGAHINPATGLATDYLNHFNEAIMLLEMLSSCPECRADLFVWQPMSYREHFEASRSRATQWRSPLMITPMPMCAGASILWPAP